MANGLTVRPFATLPHDITELLWSERDEGHTLVLRLVNDWKDGSNRFDATGEIAIEARVADRLVGVGGLNRDPYLSDPRVGRLRHVYVSPDVRGTGVGRALVEELVERARGHFERVRLRTVTPEGSRFYVALGFQPTPDEQDSTHAIVFTP